MSAKSEADTRPAYTKETFPWEPDLRPGQSRPLTTAEKELYQQMIALRDSRFLPDFAETEPGAWLYAIMETWRTEAGRDGRKGHVKDEDIAERLRVLAGEGRYDRNRFQLEFGKGKIIRDYKKENGKWVDHRYQKPVNRNTATKVIELALTYWNLRSKEASANPDGPRWKYCSSFPLLSKKDIKDIAWISGDLMFQDMNDEVYCRPAVGHGPKLLLRELGERGYSIAHVARDAEVVVLNDPDSQIKVFADLLSRILNTGLAPRLGTVNIWTLQHPDSFITYEATESVREEDVRISRARRIEHLRYLLRTLQWTQTNLVINEKKLDSDFPVVPLDRCFIAIYKAESEIVKNSSVFRKIEREEWLSFGISATSEKYVDIYAYSSILPMKRYIFPLEMQAQKTPYIMVEEVFKDLEFEKMIQCAEERVANAAANRSKNGDVVKGMVQLPERYCLYTVEEFITEKIP
ncbi:MAG: hypothetical protein MUC44_08880 [Beijerinckiaceae bacterium]|nr:hypothetical protein [Beijerinckiaceae bacterium]